MHHLSLHPNNVLLDDALVPKLSDHGRSPETLMQLLESMGDHEDAETASAPDIPDAPSYSLAFHQELQSAASCSM